MSNKKQIMMDVVKTGGANRTSYQVKTKAPQVHSFIWMLVGGATTGGSAVHTRAASAGGTVTSLNGTQCDYPRNVVIDSTEKTNTGNVVINGIDQFGDTVQETIAITSGGVTVGAQPFARIASIVFPTISDTSIIVRLGLKIGVAVNFITCALKSVTRSAGVTAFVAELGSGYTPNTTYSTVAFAAIGAASSTILFTG